MKKIYISLCAFLVGVAIYAQAPVMEQLKFDDFVQNSHNN